MIRVTAGTGMDTLNITSVLFATKYPTNELAHGKLNIVYLAELLVIMADGLKIGRIRARNVPRVHGHKRLDDDAFLTSLSLAPGKRRCHVLMRRAAVLLKHKNRLQTTCTCLTVASEQGSCRDSENNRNIQPSRFHPSS